MSLNSRQNRQRAPWRVMRNARCILFPYVPRRIMRLGSSRLSSTHRSFEFISVFKVSRNVLSFSVSFTSHHHDIGAILPGFDQTGMNEEHDRDKPPYPVQTSVITQGWQFIQGQCDRLRMGSYVRLVAPKIELGSGRIGLLLHVLAGQRIQSCYQARNTAQIHRPDRQRRGSTICEHLPNALDALLPPLTMLDHLLSEVRGVEQATIEQKARRNVSSTLGARVSADSQADGAATRRAALECSRGIKLHSAGATTALAFPSHLEAAATLGTRETDQSDLVVESPSALDKPAGLLPQSQRQGDDLTAEPPVCVQIAIPFFIHPRHDGSILCWCLGVNFRPHSLHRRIRLTPRLLVVRDPLLLDLDEPQWMQVGGLPLPMNITSRDMEETLLYKGALSLGDGPRSIGQGAIVNWLAAPECQTGSRKAVHVQSALREQRMRQHRPEGFRGQGDRHLLPISRALEAVISETFSTLHHETLRRRKPDTAKLAEILTEFAEDLHAGVGIWEAYERHNLDFFGMRLPFAPAEPVDPGIQIERVQHLLWVVYPQLKPGLVLSPHHQDLERLAQEVHACLAESFRSVPRDSGVKAFLESPNEHGWQVKRKLIWLGTRSYLFRVWFTKYLEEYNRGRWDIAHVDDFVCQECTPWSGLGVTDILAGVLDLSAKERADLRSWYERHASFYRIKEVGPDYLDGINVINDRPYRIRLDMADHPFVTGQLVFGSLVPWRGEWLWSGEQEAWDKTVEFDIDGLRDTMKRNNSQILCRFWKSYETQVRQRAEELHAAALKYSGTDLVIYPDGLAMAADWQKELRAAWEAIPAGKRKGAIKRHKMEREEPDLQIPPDLLEERQGIGVFLNPDEGKEIMRVFDPLVAGLKRRGRSLSEAEEEAIQQFIESDAVSPAFVHRVLEDYPSASVKAAFRISEEAPDYWLEYLLRSRKGHFYRKRYPTVSVL